MKTFHNKIVEAGKKFILYTPHAVHQMNSERRMISTDDVEKVIFEGEIIEDYPDDKRGHSCLMNARVEERNIHVVCTSKDDYLAIITAYIPDENKWDKKFRKRKAK